MNLNAVRLLLMLFALPLLSKAQTPTLPDIEITSKDGINVLKWMNPYVNGVESVTIQRSSDSTFNYVTIGIIKDLKNPEQNFVDTRSRLGRNWYRVVVLFTSGTDWISNLAKVTMDSASIANRNVLPPSDSLQKMILKIEKESEKQATVTNSEKKKVSSDELIGEINKAVSYTKSKYVFTNPFTGHVDIEVADAAETDYELRFYDLNGKEVILVPRLNENSIVLDKRNFPHSGVYEFKLLKTGRVFEKGFVSIY